MDARLTVKSELRVGFGQRVRQQIFLDDCCTSDDAG